MLKYKDLVPIRFNAELAKNLFYKQLVNKKLALQTYFVKQLLGLYHFQ